MGLWLPALYFQRKTQTSSTRDSSSPSLKEEERTLLTFISYKVNRLPAVSFVLLHSYWNCPVGVGGGGALWNRLPSSVPVLHRP